MIRVQALPHYDCDVLIAGGGPSGSGLAFHLASAGLKVIVAESGVFPRDKVCGDGVSPIALAELAAMGIAEAAQFNQANEIKRVGLFLENDKVSIKLSKPEHLPYHARIIPRRELDNWIYEAAQKAGAEYLEGTRVTDFDIQSDGALVRLRTTDADFTLNARMIVGADGGRSTLARRMHGAKPQESDQLLGLRAYYKNVNGPTDQVDIYFNDSGFPGIMWLFPKGPQDANIGIAMVAKTFPKKPDHIKEILLAHINNNPDIKRRIGDGEPDDKIRGWPITIYNPRNRVSDARILLVGEAAGLINPLSGDGIQYALLSARWAAATIIDCVQRNSFTRQDLDAYARKVKQEVSYDFALSNLLVHVPRNKTFNRVWIRVLTSMIAQARDDGAYADTIAGVFEGTYPSYKAVSLSFILKSLKQFGLEAGKDLGATLQNPQHALSSGAELTRDIFTMLEELKDNPRDNISWLGDGLVQSASVLAHLVKSLDARSLKNILS